MARQSDLDRLRHMLDFARTARKFSRKRKRADLDADQLFELAMARLLEVIGEAASRVSKACQAQHPEVPWRLIIGMRNRLIHGYDTINPDITWQVLAHDLPPRIKSLKEILASRALPKARRKGKKKSESDTG
jgi:uncharacterized protein with HEPN domain